MFGFAKNKSSAAPESKTRSVRHLIAMHSGGSVIWTPRNYRNLIREGFMQNTIVYRCVRMIAEAAASVPVTCENELVTNLLGAPNLEQTSAGFFEDIYGYLLLSGNGYMELVELETGSYQMHVLRPDRVKVIIDKSGRPSGWEYKVGPRKVRLFKDFVQGRHPVLHLKLFHPDNDHYGMSPVEAAARVIDIHNAGGAWNKSMLDNAARPSGALVFHSQNADRLSEEQFQRLKSELEQSHQGKDHAGRPILLEGGLDWKPMALSPTDMDFQNGQHAAAREIALAFGVPPMLLGIPGDNTFANYQEANRAFWRQTILPLVQKTTSGLENWLRGWFGDQLVLSVCADRVPALQEDQSGLWKRISEADFLSDEEKRQFLDIGSANNKKCNQ